MNGTTRLPSLTGREITFLPSRHAERHRVSVARARYVVRGVVKQDIHRHNVLARAYYYVFGRDLGKIPAQPLGARGHAGGRHGSDEKYIRKAGKLVYEFLRAGQ